VGVIVTSRARLCRLCRLGEPAHAAATAGFSIQEGEIPRETDCLLEGDGFELLVPLHEGPDFPRGLVPSRRSTYFRQLVVGKIGESVQTQ
jgi:hypothetical protein